jgi:hypothetical protein
MQNAVCIRYLFYFIYTFRKQLMFMVGNIFGFELLLLHVTQAVYFYVAFHKEGCLH